MPNGLKDRPAATKHEAEIRPKGSHSPQVPLSAIGPTTARSSSRARSSPEVDRVAVRIVTDNQVIQFIPSEKRDGLTILKQSCGFSTQVRNGICCRKAIPTTKRYIGAFRLGAAMRFCGGCCRRLLTSFATEVRWERPAVNEARAEVASPR